jgi:hypothetical protein
VDSQGLRNRIPRDLKTESPYKGTEITTDITQEKTATTEIEKASAAVLSVNDLMIGSKLTSNQLKVIAQTAKEIARSGDDQALLELGIAETLKDSISFTHAGKDFKKKIATIIKCYKSGKWSIPASVFTKKENSWEKANRELITKFSHQRSDVEHLKKSINHESLDDNNRLSLQAILKTSEIKPSALVKEIKRHEANIPSNDYQNKQGEGKC